MKLFVCIYDDARLLPAFLRHYRRFGVDEYHVAVSDDLAAQVAAMSREHVVHLHRDLNEADSILGGVAAVTRMRKLHQGEDEAVVIVELDEFVEFSGPVGAVVTRMEAMGANVTRGIIYDRFAMDGQPKDITETSDLAALFPVRARFTREVMGGVDVKGVVVRGRLDSNGAHHHFTGERVADEVLDISRYKWTDGALERVRSTYETLAEDDIQRTSQYKNVIDHYETHGRFVWQTFGGEVVGPKARPPSHAISEPRIRMVELANVPVERRAAEMASVERVLDSGTWILGDEVDAFEQEWARACGTRAAVGVGSGTAAIEIGLRALGLGLGDAVIVPAMTAFATVLAVMRAGCEPVIADVDPETALLDPESAERCLSPRVRAVVLVHLYGRVADLQAWRDWTESHDLYLVEDCAHAHLGGRGKLKAGAVGVLGAWSFDPTGNLAATGDAGAIVTSDPRVLNKARRLRDYGRDRGGRHVDRGTNSRLDELQAALLRTRLEWLAESTERRRAIASAYREGVTNPQIELLAAPEALEQHVYHQFVVRSGRRKELAAHLAEHGIQTRMHYSTGTHEQPLTGSAGSDPQGLQHATRHARRCLSLPIHPALSDEEVAQVINAANTFA